MANTNPARGMRDFLPSDIRKRNYVINIIKEVYESYGFEPLETPAVENIETLMGKYGEEGNQLIFKILKRGEHEKTGEADLALRYDLTVPTARVIANNKNELPKFFKRYQIQPVWRADRPARGRFREFYQCDVDAIGSKSMVVEAELISAVCEILEKLGFEDFVVRVNHREILSGLLNVVGIPVEKHIDVLVALDKIDKIGRNGVQLETEQKGIGSNSIDKLLSILNSVQSLSEDELFQLASLQAYIETLANQREGMVPRDSVVFQEIISENRGSLGQAKNGRIVLSNIRAMTELSKSLKTDHNGWIAVEELISLWGQTNALKLVDRVQIDPTLARGLSYYTGAIFEIVLTNGDFAGSIGGGGRYDGLIGMFGKEEIPACGFSLGLERIIVVMTERGMFPPELEQKSADVMVTIWNEESIAESLKLASELRKSGLRVLVYPEADKMGKQFKYAGQINVPYVCVIGESELAENKVSLKNMVTGEQEVVAREEVAGKIK
jgi:histidyl-tRNA synthetase